MQSHSPLAVLLSDMQRAGITDVVHENPFNFTEGKIVSPFAETPSIQVISSTKKEEIKTEAPASTAVEIKDTNKAFSKREIADLVWSFGDKNSAIQVVLSSSMEKGVHPLSVEAKGLFVKMLKAIDIEESEVSYFVLAGADTFSKSEVAMAHESLEQTREGAVFMFVGEEATQLAFKEGVLKARKKKTEFTDKLCGVLMHPEALLTQPSFKKIAWQDLLRFKSLLEGKQ